MRLTSRQLQARREQTKQIQQLAAQGKPLPANLANSQNVKTYSQAALKASGKAAYNPRTGTYVGSAPVPIQTESGRTVTAATSGPRGKDPVINQLEQIKRQEHFAAIEREQRRPFEEAAQAEQQAKAAQEAFQKQLEEQRRIQAEVSGQLAEAESRAKIAGRRSSAVSAQLRSRAMLEQAQVQQAQGRAVQALQKSQKPTGATVGQPGRARTRVGSGLSIGGYGGTRATRVSPTGLNI